MSKRNDVHKVLIIGSGPIIIGQACEFDYSGTQACKALRQLGYEIVLVNSNPATIMTDPGIADVTYIEPLNVERLEQIIAKLGLPPFILGLSWSTTERMSQQQAEILASELESYRNLLTPVILRICRYHLNLKGLGGSIAVKWKHVSMSDEVEQARAQLLRMQAKQIERALEENQTQTKGEKHNEL